jgi:DNA polymerase-3 subunit alpha
MRASTPAAWSSRPALTDFTPLYWEDGAQGIVTQFDKDDVEAAGLVKFDFLGLRTLTIIDWAVKTINARRAASAARARRTCQWTTAAFRLLQGCTHHGGVFQLESRGMRDLIKRLQTGLFRRHRRAGGAVPSRPAAVGHGG